MRTVSRIIALCAAALAAVPVAAALPPNYQRLAELRAVLGHPEVGRAFGNDPIDRIEYVRADLFRLTAGRCRLDVAIVGLPTPPTCRVRGASRCGPEGRSARVSVAGVRRN